MIYEFDLPDEVTSAVAQITVGNQFVIGVAAAQRLSSPSAITCSKPGSRSATTATSTSMKSTLANYLTANPGQNHPHSPLGWPTRRWLGPLPDPDRDRGQPAPASPTSKPSSARPIFSADSMSMTKSTRATTRSISRPSCGQQPGKEVFVKFTDGSTADGWGPGVFWMAVHSGPIEILSDRRSSPI
jgi:hypothetical protein